MAISENGNEQVVPVNLNQLKQVKVTNVNGRTYIVGTNEPQIKVRCTNGSKFTPSIGIKNDGTEAEIKAMGGIRIEVNFDSEGQFDFDPDLAESAPATDFNAGDEPQPWGFPETSAGREDYRQAREEYRERRQMAREAYQEAREQRREQVRQIRDQVREAQHEARMAQDRIGLTIGEVEMNAENFASIFKDVGKNIGEIFSQWGGGRGDLYIEVPNGVELEVKTTSGHLDISNINGFCRVRSTNGHTSLKNLRGGLQLKSASGSLTAQGLSGSVVAKLASGHLNFSRCEMSGMDLSVQSGSVTVETVLMEGPDSEDYRINASSGHITFKLPALSRASIECRTLSGRIVAGPEFGPTDYKNRPGQSRLKLDMNKGGRKVNITTLSGNINLGLYDPANPSSDQPVPPRAAGWPMPPMPPAPPMPSVPPMPPAPPMPPVPPFGPTTPSGEPNIRYRPPTVATPEPLTIQERMRGLKEFAMPEMSFQDGRPAEPGDLTSNSPLITPPPSSPIYHEWPGATTSEQETAVVGAEKSNAASVEPNRDAAAAKTSQNDKNQGQLEILRAIERGEISVEEGLARLSRLED